MVSPLEQALANDMMATMHAVKSRAVDPYAILNGDLSRRKAGKRLMLPYVRMPFSHSGLVGIALGTDLVDDIMLGANSRNFFDNGAADSTEYEDGILCGFFATCDVNYFDSNGGCPQGFAEALARRLLSYLEIEVYPTADQREPALHSTKLRTFADQLRVLSPIPWDDEDATCKLIRNATETSVVINAPGPAGGTFECSGELTIFGLFLDPDSAARL